MNRWQKFWCNRMGWHPKKYRERIWFDGLSWVAICNRCGFMGLEDSQGNLF